MKEKTKKTENQPRQQKKKQIICHCLDCRKISGSTYSTNLRVPAGAGFRVTAGAARTVAKTADTTGNTVTSHFCGDCGSTLFRTGPTFGDGVTIVKAGVMDDPAALDHARPAVELFVGHRVAWVPELPDTQKLPAMPS